MENNFILLFLVLFPMAGGVVSYIIGRFNKSARNYAADVVVLAEFAAVLLVFGQSSVFHLNSFCGLGINFESGGIRGVFTVAASFVWLMATFFSAEYFKNYRNRNRYYFFMLVTLGSTMGVFLSSDFFTALIFFEIMSFTSFVLVIHDETPKAQKAAMTYIAVAIIGGMATLAGMFFMYHSAGTLNFSELGKIISADNGKTPYYIYGVLIFTGFGAKAGAFPLHIWLPEAHPAAPAPASAILSCVLTKTGIFGVMALSCQVFMHDARWGMFILSIGTITMFLGAFLAVFSVDLKRTLACSSLSQIGFIMVAIGMSGLLGEENSLAAAGAILHVVNHSVIKLTLFLCAGVVYMNTHKLNLNDIKGWGRDKPLLKFVFLQGLLGIAGIPLWGGYISKTLIHESVVEYIAHGGTHGGLTIFNAVEWIFLISGGLTLAYMTKIFAALFVEKEKSPKKENHSLKNDCYMNKVSSAVLIICALLISVFGIAPHATLDKIAGVSYGFLGSVPPDHSVHYFSLVNLKGAFISVVIGAVVYFVFIKKFLMSKEAGNTVYKDVWPVWLNIENSIYRPVVLKILPTIGYAVAGTLSKALDFTLPSIIDAALTVASFLYSLFENLLLYGLIALVKVIRFMCDVYSYGVQLVLYFLFNYDDISYDGERNFREDAYFSRYSEDKHGEITGFRENLTISLIMFGIGVVCGLVYLII